MYFVLRTNTDITQFTELHKNTLALHPVNNTSMMELGFMITFALTLIQGKTIRHCYKNTTGVAALLNILIIAFFHFLFL
jgi:hypothetical protein